MWHKIPAPANFRYPSLAQAPKSGHLHLSDDDGEVRIAAGTDDTLSIRVALGKSRGDVPTPLIAPYPVPVSCEDGSVIAGALSLQRFADGSIRILHRGSPLLDTPPNPFGFSGRRQIALFNFHGNPVVYGLGEKTGPLNKAGKSYQFYNLDVVADHPHHFTTDHYDPAYVSIPLYISRRGTEYYGILLDNPYRCFVHTGLHRDQAQGFHPALGLREPDEPVIAFGSYSGELSLTIIPGPSLREVVRRLARLTGTHELPPLWALGYHQCRWSYMSAAELHEVSNGLAKARIPCGALWMDIDYMEAFKVFTFRDDVFSAEQRREAFSAIRARGTRLVTIVDPGVKAEPGYHVFDEALDANLLCQTEAGQPYIGIVWPGRTAFPDFSLLETRTWWAGHIDRWLAEGIDGIWIDMNDPSTGPIDFTDMRFRHGTQEHDAFHNLYGNLMAEATRLGFEAHDPQMRPFILTRSASTGIQRHAAVWTGDNASNEAHLAMSIPMSLNLSLSGVAFNGPDVGGFMGDASEELFRTWMLAGSLFPFFRNHSCAGTRRQEPYAYSEETLGIVRNLVNTRAKLLPYLYTLFAQHQRDGDAILRPLSYEFSGEEYETIGDQFLVGPSLLAAPFVRVDQKERSVVLPEGWWFALHEGGWIEGGKSVLVLQEHQQILFVRDGSIIPTAVGADHFPQPDLSRVELHVFRHSVPEAVGELYQDDGETKAYAAGAYRSLRVRSGAEGLSVEILHDGYSAAPREAVVYHYEADAAESVEWPFQSYQVRREMLSLAATH
jgi:alpha-glucosidase